MNKILGLDLGTNSIGWSLIEYDFDSQKGKILGLGSRIIPLSQDVIGEFDRGNSVSQTAERTGYRRTRRLRERHLLRRERLHRVLNVLGFLPEHYAEQIDFKEHLGQFLDEKEPKLAWKINDNGKYEFAFQKSFNEMIEEFKSVRQDMKVPYDWTIYYLRKKALLGKIEKEELAWLILNFNQKRGYYQLRGEEMEEKPDKLVEFHSLKVVNVIADGVPDHKGETWYSLHLENGWIYRRSSKTSLAEWKDTVRDFIVTSDLDANGEVKKDKDGNERRSFRAPGEDDWTLIKKRTEQEINKTGKTIGTYIYDTLLIKPHQKIGGRLIRTIERKFYKDELRAILNVQRQYHPELRDDDLYNDCVRELYGRNEARQLILSKRDFVHLFLEDIIFYQRPLRSQKSSVGNCSLEFRTYKEESGVTTTEYLKAIPKSNPLYQEFRIWKWLHDLKIYQKDEENDVTLKFISNTEDREKLFDFLSSRKETDQKALLRYLLEEKGLTRKALKVEIEKYRWNYVEDKIYPCNETGIQIKTRMIKVKNVPNDFLTSKIELELWHIIYSVNDRIEYEKALRSFANKHGLDEISFLESFIKFPPFKSEYGAYSVKAIKKILPLMRLGKYWDWKTIDVKVQNRINRIISGEYDEGIKNRVRERTIELKQDSDFQGLQEWLAKYIVYDRHSESAFTGKWNSVKDLERYLEDFKQHSLRNPIVEQVVTETLRVIKDIWSKYGNGERDFFQEIHIELGREMKNTAEDRKRISDQVSENENTNLRIKALIMELKDNSDGKLPVDDVRPYSPVQQEALKIYEEGVLNSNIEIPNDILKISKNAQPSKTELQRYKLWLEQKYRSPYTGQTIPLNKLFTEAYQIDHIIPQSRYFDDSFNNKVICEAAVNQIKDKQLGLEFIKNHHGEKIETGLGQTAEIFTEEAYQQFVKQHYARNRPKRNKLLLEEIPDKMIERQLNDTRYISKYISNVLSNIVRSDTDDDGNNSKNVLPVNGKITSTLRQEWGLDSVWNELILPRFERLNKLTGTENFISKNAQNKLIPTVPLELSKGFQKKRVDHRHHALDALVIACATRHHINLMNNKHANSDNIRYDLRASLCYKRYNDDSRINYNWQFHRPWENFTKDAKDELEKIIVSFKQNLRVINKTSNKYERITEKNGTKVKELVPQTKGDSWAIRKPLHKETISGEVKLSRIKVPKGKILTATRKVVDTSFDMRTIESITDTGIQKILKNYLKSRNNDPVSAFSPEGLEEMNKSIALWNDGKQHQPIYKVRIFELGSKFRLGQTGNKRSKFVEAAKGTNLFFAIYLDEYGKRSFETIPLNIVIERQKQGLSAVPETDEKGNKLLFHLSPNDLVYVPSEDEIENNIKVDIRDLSKEKIGQIYKVVSFTNNRLYGVPSSVATSIANKVEFSQLNKIEFIKEKEVCIKFKINRLGAIIDKIG